MKKITPFQKKVARWAGGHRFVRQVENIAFVTLITSMVMVSTATSNIIWLSVSLTICGAILASSALCKIDSIKSYWNQLPETQAAGAKEFLEANLKYSKRIEELIQEAFAQDDGGELREALEKFKILAGKEKSLADLPNQAEKLKTEIVALEKELGLCGG